jgi:uncharacterized damage-inducible protein DinB
MTAIAASPTLVDALLTQIKYCHSAAHMNLEGLSPEESLVRHRPGANSANWILGHITWVRQAILRTLGENLIADDRLQQYRRGSDGDVADPIPFMHLLALFDRFQPLLESRLQNLTDANLTAKSAIRSPAGADANLGAALASLVFHESYHVGQLGVARRLLGKPGAIK